MVYGLLVLVYIHPYWFILLFSFCVMVCAGIFKVRWYLVGLVAFILWSLSVPCACPNGVVHKNEDTEIGIYFSTVSRARYFGTQRT